MQSWTNSIRPMDSNFHQLNKHVGKHAEVFKNMNLILVNKPYETSMICIYVFFICFDIQ